MNLKGKIFWGQTFEDLEKSVNNWLGDVDVHLFKVSDAVDMGDDQGWLVSVMFYYPCVMPHKTTTLVKPVKDVPKGESE